MIFRPKEGRSEQLELVWIDCPYTVANIGLARILEDGALVHSGAEPPETSPSVVIFGVGGIEGLLEGVKRIRAHGLDAPILIFGLYLDLSLATAALRAGARGYIHAGMPPEQITRAVDVALEGEIVAPRQLLEYLIANEDVADLNILSSRQREILKLVDDGLTNSQIAKKLFLTESTVKQHLRSAYKALGVSNRTEAARIMRNGD